MRKLFLFVLTVVIVGSCKKQDISHFPPVFLKCDVVRYSSKPFTGLSFGNGLEKTYYENTGAIKSVRQMIALLFSDADSVYYDFQYRTSSNQIIVTVNCLKKHFLVVAPDFTPIPIPNAKDEQYTITAILDKRNGRLIQISGTTNPNQNPNQGSRPGTFDMQYQGDRLISFGKLTLVYDSLGNIIRVPAQPTDVTNTAMIYGYDYTKTAKNQFYITSGYYVHEYYNLAEICGWIPIQPNNIRNFQSYLWGDYRAGETYFRNHVVDAQGFLLSYVDDIWNAEIVNTWRCGSSNTNK